MDTALPWPGVGVLCCDNIRLEFEPNFAEVKEQTPEEWREGRDAIIESLAMRLHRLSTRTYLILAD